MDNTKTWREELHQRKNLEARGLFPKGYLNEEDWIASVEAAARADESDKCNEHSAAAFKRGREEAVYEISKKMKIAEIVKPNDRTGLLVWLDDETLSEESPIYLINGDEVKGILAALPDEGADKK